MVKFGAMLRDDLRHEGWGLEYIGYKGLKKIISRIVDLELKDSTLHEEEAMELRDTFAQTLSTQCMRASTFIEMKCRGLEAERNEAIERCAVLQDKENLPGSEANKDHTVAAPGAEANHEHVLAAEALMRAINSGEQLKSFIAVNKIAVRKIIKKVCKKAPGTNEAPMLNHAVTAGTMFDDSAGGGARERVSRICRELRELKQHMSDAILRELEGHPVFHDIDASSKRLARICAKLDDISDPTAWSSAVSREGEKGGGGECSVAMPYLSIEQQAGQPVPKRPGTRIEVIASIVMVISGALQSFFGSVFYKFSETSSLVSEQEGAGAAILKELWITYLLIVSIFGFCTLGCALFRENRAALYARRRDVKFIRMLLFPSAMDVLVTGLQTLALAFADPALVNIIKTTTQLVCLALLSRVVLKQKLRPSQWLCLGTVIIGVILAALVKIWKRDEDDGSHSGSDQMVGLLLSLVSGLLGASRNLAEAVLLGDDDLPPSALLLAESALSLLATLPFMPLLFANPRHDDAVDLLVHTFTNPWAPAIFFLHMLCAYGKDAGKFWLIKHASALRAKLVSLIFPFGTWLAGIVVFYAGGRDLEPKQGVGIEMPYSLVQLVGFNIILGANFVFVLLKQKKSRVTWLCLPVDRCFYPRSLEPHPPRSGLSSTQGPNLSSTVPTQCL